MSLPDTSVKYFDSTMAGSPVLSGTVGTLIALLDACLVNGFGSVTVNNLTVTGNVATVTVSAGHGLAMCGSTGPVIVISGATPAGLNGEWRVASVISPTQFTFATAGISDQTATGTITLKRAGAGWTKPFSGTNKAAYLMNQAGGNPHYLYVDDSAAVPTSANGRWAMMMGYETMSSIDDTTGQRFPTAAQSLDGLLVVKSNASDVARREWWLVADPYLVYFGTFSHNNYPTYAVGYCFGKVGSFRDADAFDTLIVGNIEGMNTLPSYPGQNNYFSLLTGFNSSTGGFYFARSHTQIGTSVKAAFLKAEGPTSIMGNGGYGYPWSVNNGVLVSRPSVGEGEFRAPTAPGLYYPQHTAPFVHNAPLELLVGLEGKTLRVQSLAYTTKLAQCLIDITGPWER